MAANLTLMFYLGWHNWVRLFVWLAIGLAIYLAYGRRHSRIARDLARELAGGVSPAGRLRD
jgi:APA family basic amino acid/polyamine antiporter